MIRQARSFILVGLAATAAHFAVMGLLIQTGTTSAQMATFVGSLVGSLVAYFANRQHTFRSRVPHLRAIPRHYVVVAGSILLNAAVFGIAHGRLGTPVWFAQGLATGVCMVFNFIASRFWVFRDS